MSAAGLAASLFALLQGQLQEQQTLAANAAVGDALWGSGSVEMPEAVEYTEYGGEAIASGGKVPPTFTGDALAKGISTEGVSARLIALSEFYPDIVGWLNIHCLYQVNFPVFQRDNTYYLTHDANGTASEKGAAFLDEYCNISPRDDNLIVYAHNLASGEMFGSLFRMQSLSFLAGDPLVTFATAEEADLYVPFAVVRMTTGTANDFDFLTEHFDSEAQFERFLSEAKRRSTLAVDVDVIPEDALLTLVTCNGAARQDWLVVFLRRLRSDETAEGVREAYFK